MFKSIIITDIHLQNKGESAFGTDTRRKFETVLERLGQEDFEFLVVAGDLCFQSGNLETYAYCKKQLDGLGVPFAVIPGNHDDAPMMSDIFDLPLTDGELYFEKNLGGSTCLFLDTGKGFMGDAQWRWLSDHLSLLHGQHRVFVFMHHPPTPGFIPHMDHKYPFQQLDKWEALVAQYGALNLHVFTGHYHQSFTINKGNFTVYLTPSTAMQIDDKLLDFGMDHEVPAYRRLWFDENQVYTAVRYVFS